MRTHDFPTRRRLYLMRHGEVNYFEHGRPAPPEGVHLNEQGRAQAAAAALALADISFDRVVTSGLPRTLETAAFLLGESFGDFRDRVLPAFHALIADTSWSAMLLVAHGAVNRVILADVLDLDLHGIGHIEQDAGCINLLDFDEPGYGIVRLVNYTPYNPLKLGLALTTMERYFLDFPPGEDS